MRVWLLAALLVAALFATTGCCLCRGGRGDGHPPATVRSTRGEILLRKFPPPEWGEARLKEIITREIRTGEYRNAQEREFIDNYHDWVEALEERKAGPESVLGGK